MPYLWTLLGLISLSLGALGIVLPLLPTVPFLLLATFFFARGSDRLHDWLVSHPVFGPPIQDWQTRGAINRTAKKLATLSIATVFSISLIFGVSTWVLAIQALTLSAVLLFIWTRPSQ